MVALLASMQWRLLCNSLRGNMLKVVALVLWTAQLNGALVALGAVIHLTSATSLTLHHQVTVGALSCLTIAWLVVPVMFDSTQAQLMPGRFATFAVDTTKLAWGLYVSSLLSAVMPAFVILLVLFALSFSGSGLLTLVAFLGATLGWCTTTLGARTLAVWLSGGRRSRARQERHNLMVVGLLLLGAIGFVAVSASFSSSGGLPLRTLLRYFLMVCSWSPLGAPWALPGSWAAGNLTAATGQGLISGLTALALTWLWPRAVRRALANPKYGSGNANVEARRVVGFRQTRTVSVVRRLQLVLCYRDPRMRQALITVAMMCLILIVLPLVQSDTGALMATMYAVVFPLAVALIGPSLASNVLAFTDRAVAIHAVTKITGVEDIWGRISALMLIFMPLSLLVLGCSYVAYPQMSRATLALIIGTQLMLLLGGSGIGAYCSVRLPRPMPKPKGPFGGASSTASGSLVAGLVAILQLAAATPVLVLGALGHWQEWAQSACVLLALCGGLGLLVVGVLSAGRYLNGHYPEVISALSKPT